MSGSRVLIFFLFWLALLIDCLLILLHKTQYRIYAKTLLAPLLLIAIFIEAGDTKHVRSKLIANAAFFFCFLGDLILLKDYIATNFIFGLISFLVAHIFFIVFFYRLKPFTTRHAIPTLITSIIIAGYMGLLLFFIWNNVNQQNFTIPIVVYSVVIGFMLLTAINTKYNRRIKRLAYTYFIPGAILFVLSDSILAFAKFDIPFDYSPVLIMLTYGIGIFLLANGMIRYLKK
jgi:uncharacterized membrane protein YhhN